MKYHNGDVYKGIFVNNIKHGKVEMKNNKGDIFIGEWKNVIFKEGEINYINDDYYIGDYKINNEIMKGIMIYNNGNEYNGNLDK